ncbi:MAG: chemotaxis protein CheW [Roseiflexaceae bacterium]
MELIPEAMVLRSASPSLIVSFWLGSQEYGLPLEAVREVVRLPALVTLAGATPALCGLLNLRGYYLPVLDGRVLVGEAPRYALSNQIIIVGHARPKLGVLVDQVNGVAAFSRDVRTPIQTGIAAPLLDSVITSEHGALIMLDLTVLASLAAAGQQAAIEQSVAVLIEPS